MSERDGGSAFPYSALTPEGPQIYGDSKGMTLRDWFAGQALALGEQCLTDYGRNETSTIGLDATARGAYLIADAMLKARTP